METGSTAIVEGASNIGDVCVSEGVVPSMDSVGAFVDSVGASVMENIGEGSVVGGDVLSALGGDIAGDNHNSVDLVDNVFVDLVDNVFVEGEDVGGDVFGGVVEGAGASGINVDAVGGEVKLEDVKERESVEGGGGEGSVSGGGEDAIGGGSGGGGGDSEGVNVANLRPVPLITRRRLREILAHAEGECIVLVCI